MLYEILYLEHSNGIKQNLLSILHRIMQIPVNISDSIIHTIVFDLNKI